jgi:hypothetical protein
MAETPEIPEDIPFGEVAEACAPEGGYHPSYWAEYVGEPGRSRATVAVGPIAPSNLANATRPSRVALESTSQKDLGLPDSRK